ncbi:hypothetical protein SA496_15690 [Pseudomonas sp. JS3066]|uniref:hypothetical protein n=1 Tax=Pseudomonas sp. JS3066 TaxID=3090665 RepID=UPI002E7B2EE4|nr:hypothetical protein [Pseudomonas sp. JS3066]WVK91171.1 hypothetical protein SA496_15690 [Pseudomonas sp. JS3066]
MSLPVKACSDDELEGYAAIHPEAAEELARRIVAGQGAREVELDEVRQQLRDSEEREEELERDLEKLNDRVEDAITKLRALMDDYSVSEDLEDEINRVADSLEVGL